MRISQTGHLVAVKRVYYKLASSFCRYKSVTRIMLCAKVSAETFGEKSQAGKIRRGRAENKRYENFVIRLIRDLCCGRRTPVFSIAHRREACTKIREVEHKQILHN